MRRFTLASAAAAAAAIVLAIPMGASAQSDNDVAAAGADSVADELEALRLECDLRSTDAGPAVGCTWSAPTSPRAAGVRLYRLDPATDPSRQVIFRTNDVAVTHYTDTNVRPGHRYAYAVQALNANGRVVAQSRTEWVEVPGTHDVEVLRLECVLGPAHEAIVCEWSRPESRDAYVLTLWRSVDGAAREVVERFRPAGPNVYRDPVPAGASQVTYALIATSETDRIVARSRAATVRIPDVRPSDVRPTDVRPSDVRPSDVRPTDVRPSDVRPSDVRPSDVRPSDVRPSGVRPSDVRPSDVRPSDVRLSDVRPTDIGRASSRWADVRPAVMRLIRELAAL